MILRVLFRDEHFSLKTIYNLETKVFTKLNKESKNIYYTVEMLKIYYILFSRL